MNYAGKFDATHSFDGQGEASHSEISAGSFARHAPADPIVIPDAHFLFNADFKRSGVDLILAGDDRELVLHDYFKGEKRAALASPDGAHLTGDLVNALTGAVQYSQVGAPAAGAQVIGHVSKLVGGATAIRNGVSIILNQGDNVEKGDVVQSGSNSTLGITFIDGTVFGLSSNARMVLNEMVYDPNGSNNSSLLSLVAGTITFVAGATAKHGDMKIDTPVATMGIRGTAVLVEIDFTVPGQNATPDAKFQVLVEPDGTTGSYILFDKTTLQPIAVVNQAGQQINISNGVVSQTSAPLPPDVQKLITDVFSLKFTDNNTNPKTTTAFNDSLNPFLIGPTIKLANNTTATPVYQVVNNQGSSNLSSSSAPQGGHFHVPEAPIVVILDHFGHVNTAFALTELPGKTGDTADFDQVSAQVNFVDINAGDTPTVSVSFDNFTYQNAQHQNITASLNALQLADIRATELKFAVVNDPGNNNNGGASFNFSIADKAFDFLAVGETLTLTYVVKVDNNFAQNDQATTTPITITITGTNDAPVITTGPHTIDFSGGTSVPGGPLTSSSPTSGTLDFTDVDLTDTHTVATALTSAVLSGSDIPPAPLALFEKALTASIETDSTGSGNGIIDWQLAPLPAYVADFIPKGETLALTYTVTVTDSQGATSTQTITVDITGTDHAAVVWIATGSVGGLWSNAANWETGTVPTANDDVIIITDQLIGLTPSYPVTIDLPALAKSVTMNDFSDVAPELDNLSTLTIGGALNLSADSILHNFGTMSVGGRSELLDISVLVNSGTLTLGQGGDFADQSSVTNDSLGTIEVSGGTLNVAVDIANSGKINVDPGATLALGAATIDGGTVTINGQIVVTPSFTSSDTLTIIDFPLAANGTLDLQGSSALQDGTLINTGLINVGGTGNALDHETVTNNGAIDIAGALVLENATTVTSGATNAETVESTGSLTLQDTSSIKGGQLINLGNIYVEASSGATFDGVNLANTGGAIHVDISGGLSAKLILDDRTTITGGSLAIGSVGTLEVSSAAGATLSGLAVSNSGLLEVDINSLLILEMMTISAGALTNDGTLDSTATSALNGVGITNSGLLESTGGVLSIDPGTLSNSGTVEANGGELDVTNESITNTGTLQAINDSILKLSSSMLTNTDGTVTAASGATLDLISAAIDNGLLGNSGTLDSTGSSALDGVGITNSGLMESIGGVLTVDPVVVPSATLSNSGKVEANGGELDITSEPVTNTGTLQALNDGILKLSSTTVTNSGGTVTVASGAVLDLIRAAIDDGSLGNSGTLDSTGLSALDGVGITNSGLLESTGAGSLTIDPGTLSNSGTVEANGGELDITGEAVGNTGTLAAIGGGTLKLTSTTVSDTGSGSVMIGSGSILDLDHSGISGGTLSNGGTLYNLSGNNTISAAVHDDGGTIEVNAGTLDLAGGLSGSGTVIIDAGAKLELAGADGQTITFSGGASTLQLDLTSLQFTGTIAGQSSTGGNFTITGTANVTSGSGDGIDFTASGGTYGNPAGITLTPSGSIISAANGILVIQNGVGDISIDPTGSVTGVAGTGIIAEDSATGSGNISVYDTASITGNGSGSDGLLVQNLDAANGGAITVTSLGGATGDGYGIDTLNDGNGDVTVESAGTVTSNVQYGIRVRDFGTGHVSITADDGSIVNSGSSGIVAVNRDTVISSSAGSTITVTAYGTINSGTDLNLSGTQPAGILAGYNGIGGTASQANTDVNGTVLVYNHANITAKAGYGIEAYNYGNGDVTVNDEAGTVIDAALQGISATEDSGGTGNVSVDVGASAKITAGSSYGIGVLNLDAGNVSVTTASGDVITSGSTGISVSNQATSIPASAKSTVTVTAAGTIHSGTDLNLNGTTPGGILAGYYPGGIASKDGNVAGDVTVQSSAAITADAGYGIDAYTFGTGKVSVTTVQGSSINAAGIGLGAFANDGGDVGVSNVGPVAGATGISTFADNGGTIHITNAGQITGNSADGVDVLDDSADSTGSTTITNDSTGTIVGAATSIVVHGNATGTVTIDNAGTIGPATVSASTSAIYEDGGQISLDNTGHIDGNINVGDGIFTNEDSGIWQPAGASAFGAASAGTIDNAGIIDLSGSASLSGPHGLSITDSGTIDNLSGANAINSAAITIAASGTLDVSGGTLTIDSSSSVANSGTLKVEGGGDLVIDGTLSGSAKIVGASLLEFGANSASAYSQATVIFTSNAPGTLKLDNPSSFTGTITGLGAGDVIDLANTRVTSAVWNGSILSVNGTPTAFAIASLPAGDTFGFKSDDNGGTDLTVLPQVETVGSSSAQGVEGAPITLNFTDALTTAGADEHATLTSFVISGIPAGATVADADGALTIVNGTVTLDQLAAGIFNGLTITPGNDANFTLSAMAIATDGQGYEYTVPATEMVTVKPTPPALSWTANVSGTETLIALGNLSETITSASGDSNSANTLTISGASSGVVLSDGRHSAISNGIDAIDVSGWSLSSLTANTTFAVVPDGNFTLTATATEVDSQGNVSALATTTEAVTVDPTPPILSWKTNVSGIETLIALGNLFEIISSEGDDSNRADTLTISGAPAGVVLSDGHHSATSNGIGPIDISGWSLSSLTANTSGAIVPDGNFILTATATEVDGQDNVSAPVTATEVVTVNPEAPTVAPVAEAGLEGTAIALNLGITINGLRGDTNILSSLVVSAIPKGAVLSDGHGDSFTATSDQTSVDIDSWNLSSLTVTSAKDASFTLNIAATEQDADGNHSTTATATEAVTVFDTPIIVGETDPSIQTVILAQLPTVLAAGTNTNSLGLPTETFDEISAGSASNNGLGHGAFTSQALHATFTATGDAGVVNGSSGVSAAPFVGPGSGHADTTNYLSIGGNGMETITFATEENAFGLYWGSIDSYNSIDFYNGTNLVASYTGADISPLLASGGQGSFASNGYVQFSDLAPFDKVVLASSSNAFELDNVSAGFISDSHVHLAASMSGTLTVNDADVGDALTASVTGPAVAEYDGSTTLPADADVAALIDPSAITFHSVKTTGGSDVLDWTYNPNNPDLDFLEPGDTLTLTFQAQVSNGHATSTAQPLTVTIVGTGASVAYGTPQNDTFLNVGGGVTIFGNGGNDTFVFNPNFKSATIGDFNVNKDTIEIDHTLFSSVSAILSSAQPANSGHDTVITDAAHDQIFLTGVTVAQLKAHQGDFHLV